MNEIECETCIKRKTKWCPNSSECYEIMNKPYYQNRIMLLEENQQLKEDILFCLKSIKQEMEISTDSRTRQEMLSCYQILNEWSDK